MGKRELLFSVTKDDFEIQTFRSGGPGGQNQNKRDTGVRIIHKDSGAVGESREQRTQGQNKKLAFTKLVNSGKFKVWHSRKVMELESKMTTEESVDKSLKNPSNIRIEVKKDKKWVVVDGSELDKGEKINEKISAKSRPK